MRLGEVGGLAEGATLRTSCDRGLNPGLNDVLATFSNNVGIKSSPFGWIILLRKRD